MSAFIPTNIANKAAKLYKEGIEFKFTDVTNGNKAEDSSGAFPTTDAKYTESRISYYLRNAVNDIDVLDTNQLFYLTKMLGIEKSSPVTLYLRTPTRIELGSFGSGATKADKQLIFDEKIMPLIEIHRQKIEDSGVLDAVILAVFKEWYNKDSPNFFTRYLEISNELFKNPNIKTISDLNSNPVDMGYGAKITVREAFFKSMLPGNGDIDSDLMNLLGFNQFIRDNSEYNQLGAVLNDPTLEGLILAKQEDPEAFNNIAAAAVGLPLDLDEGDINTLNQCAIISGLIHPDSPFNFIRYMEDYKASPLQNTGSYTQGTNRIYPVEIEDFNPHKLINNCTINKKIKNIFNSTDTVTPHNMAKGIFWVYEDNKNKLREAELSTNSMIHKKKLSSVLDDLSDNIDGPSYSEEYESFLDTNLIKADSSYYFLENTKINFDGTNPSTARNDVKVEMTWKLGSLEGLNSTMAVLGTNDGLDVDTLITIKDLITLPITKKPSTSDGPGQFITNQYSPNYSRLRLKVAPYGSRDAVHLSDCMLLDLAIIDHQINRSSETGETTLTISYRGYFEASLNMPFNDALASPETIDSRQKRQEEALDKLLENDCKPELIREALRREGQVFAREASNASAGTVLMRMQGNSLIHAYSLDENMMRSNTIGNVLDGRKMYVKSVLKGQGGALSKKDAKQLSEIVFDREIGDEGVVEYDGDGFFGSGDPSSDDLSRKRLLNKIDKNFFFLGDLMWTLLDCLYDKKSVKHRETVRNLNLRFMMGTIYVPNPKNLGGSPTIINPISIPVDLKFFVQWFNALITNKGLTHYPIGTFIRDLVERLINDVIYDTCFSLLLPDENPPLLRSRTFVSNNVSWFEKSSNGWFYPENPYGDGTKVDILFEKSLTSDNKLSGTWSDLINSKNYCVIYQQFPSYKRQLTSERNSTLREDEYTPTIYYGAKNKNYNFLSNVSFAKTNSPFLREARYFNTNYGGLSLLSNVYDLSFSFKRRKANTLFYPGCILNFVLLDWGKRWVDDPPWKINSGGSISHYFGSGDLGDSDPHKEGTISNIMGMGGYFIIKSVEYNIGETPGEFEINITTKFLGTDASKKYNRTDVKIKQIEDKEECAAVFNVIADRLNELTRGDENREVVYRATSNSSNKNNNQPATRQSEVTKAPAEKLDMDAVRAQEAKAYKDRYK